REALPELAGQPFFTLLDQVYTSGEPVSVNEASVRLDRRGDGTLVEGFFNVVCQPTRDADEHIDGVMVYAVDVTAQVLARRRAEALARDLHEQITERKEAEEERQTLVSVVENSADFIGIASLDGACLFLNRAGRELIGIEDEDEVRRTRVLDLFRPEDRAQVREKILPLVMKEGRWEGELVLRHFKTGATIPIAGNIFAIRDQATGNPLTFATVSRDITERRRQEQALAFLSESSVALSSTLDLKTTLETVPRMAVPRFADWCCIYLRDEPSGRVELAAMMHVDPAQEALFREIIRRFPALHDPSHVYGRALQSGEAYLFRAIDKAMLEAQAQDENHLAMLRAMEVGSAIIVPLSAQRRVFGLMSFGARARRRSYGPEDLVLAEELGRRAATAIDHAQLFDAARRERA